MILATKTQNRYIKGKKVLFLLLSVSEGFQNLVWPWGPCNLKYASFYRYKFPILFFFDIRKKNLRISSEFREWYIKRKVALRDFSYL